MDASQSETNYMTETTSQMSQEPKPLTPPSNPQQHDNNNNNPNVNQIETKNSNICIKPMWAKLKDLDFEYSTTAFKSHNNSFITIPKNLSACKTVYRYCCITNTW
eukprot:155570_1